MKENVVSDVFSGFFFNSVREWKFKQTWLRVQLFFNYVCLFFRDFVVKPSDYRHIASLFLPFIHL